MRNLSVLILGVLMACTTTTPPPVAAPPTPVTSTAPSTPPTRCEVLFEVLCTRVEGCMGHRTDCRDIFGACPTIDPFLDDDEFQQCAQAMVRAPCSEFNGTLPEPCQGIGAPPKPKLAPGQRDM